jgi:D-threonate/D-erythronate kinase
VRTIARHALKAGVKFFYKKTDSTLRGNIGAELHALLVATRASFIPFVPALPDLGRTTRDGLHYVQGKPIAETSFSHDPHNPIRKSRVADVLAPQANVSIRSLKPHETPASVFRGIAIYDCQSNDDLATIARTLASATRLAVLSGSVALSKYILKDLEIESPPPDPPDPLLPILFVNGSLNERALEQLRSGMRHFSKLRLTPKQLVGSHTDLTIPAGGGNLLLYSIEHLSELEPFRSLAWDLGLSENELHFRVAERVGRIAHEILASDVFRTVIVFGGDTLAALAHASHWQRFEPLMELEPGVSISKPGGTDLTLISKAGGFGDANVVDRIVAWIESYASGRST